MNSVLIEAKKASRNTSDCRATIATLRALKFGKDAFMLLHHQNGTDAQFDAYCEGVKQFVDGGNNHRVHQRLRYVLLSRLNDARSEGKDFLILAKEAFQEIPPISIRPTSK
jgi:hypothetical protein